uniref:Cytochrome P450 n=1 Tax=Panagrolaimus sp. JU765 TaxID=591449 RepID=A0AC34QIP8_9BILA
MSFSLSSGVVEPAVRTQLETRTGPTPLLFFGNALSFNNNQLEIAMKKWHKQYGDIFTIWMGTEPIITFHDAPTMFETYVKDGETFTDRLNSDVHKFLRQGKYGIFITDGELWKEHRRFAIHVLKNFGLGKNIMQERILNEIVAMIDYIKDDMKNGISEIPIPIEIDRAVGSIINGLTFGKRFLKENLKEFLRVKNFAVRTIRYAGDPFYRIMETNME